MKVKKKALVVLVVAGISAIVLSIGFVYIVFSQFFGSLPNDVATDYVKEKYGVEADVVGRNSVDYDSPVEFTLVPKKEKDLEFTVTVDRDNPTDITDTYEPILKWMDGSKELENIIGDIEKLGFAGVNGKEMRLEMNQMQGYSDLYLEVDKFIDYNAFSKEDLDTFYALYELIKKSQVNIESVHIGNPEKDGVAGNGLWFHLGAPEEMLTKEAFMIAMKTDNVEFVESEIEKRFEKEAKAISNERFHLGSESDNTKDNPHDSWFSCSELEKNGKCMSGEMYVSYTNEGFYPEYPYLKEDFTAILEFAKKMEREVNVDEIHLEGVGMTDSEDWGKQFRFGYDELPSHKSMDDFIDSIRKEMQY